MCPKGSGPHSAAKQGRSCRVAALNRLNSVTRSPDQKMYPRVLVCAQKGSGPHSAAKQGRSFRVPALNHPGSMCAQGGQGHILQQNTKVTTERLSYAVSRLAVALAILVMTCILPLPGLHHEQELIFSTK